MRIIVVAEEKPTEKMQFLWIHTDQEEIVVLSPYETSRKTSTEIYLEFVAKKPQSLKGKTMEIKDCGVILYKKKAINLFFYAL